MVEQFRDGVMMKVALFTRFRLRRRTTASEMTQSAVWSEEACWLEASLLSAEMARVAADRSFPCAVVPPGTAWEQLARTCGHERVARILSMRQRLDALGMGLVTPSAVELVLSGHAEQFVDAYEPSYVRLARRVR